MDILWLVEKCPQTDSDAVRLCHQPGRQGIQLGSIDRKEGKQFQLVVRRCRHPPTLVTWASYNCLDHTEEKCASGENSHGTGAVSTLQLWMEAEEPGNEKRDTQVGVWGLKARENKDGSKAETGNGWPEREALPIVVC